MASWPGRQRRSGPTFSSPPTRRHHHTLDSVAETGIAIVDAAHWATEHPWLRSAAALLSARLPATVGSLTTYVSDLVTDPWRLHSC